MRIGVFVLCVLSVAAIIRAGIRIFSHLYFTELRVIQEHSHEPHKRRSYAPDIRGYVQQLTAAYNANNDKYDGSPGRHCPGDHC